MKIEDDDDNDDSDDDGGDNVADEGNFVDGVTANGDVFNIKRLIDETRYFLKHKILQLGEEIKFTFCTTISIDIRISDSDIRTERLPSYIRNSSFMNIRPNSIQRNFNTNYWDTSGRSNITNIMAI